MSTKTKNKSKKQWELPNPMHLNIQIKYRTIIRENKKAYKRSRDKLIKFDY